MRYENFYISLKFRTSDEDFRAIVKGVRFENPELDKVFYIDLNQNYNKNIKILKDTFKEKRYVAFDLETGIHIEKKEKLNQLIYFLSKPETIKSIKEIRNKIWYMKKVEEFKKMEILKMEE